MLLVKKFQHIAIKKQLRAYIITDITDTRSNAKINEHYLGLHDYVIGQNDSNQACVYNDQGMLFTGTHNECVEYCEQFVDISIWWRDYNELITEPIFNHRVNVICYINNICQYVAPKHTLHLLDIRVFTYQVTDDEAWKQCSGHVVIGQRGTTTTSRVGGLEKMHTDLSECFEYCKRHHFNITYWLRVYDVNQLPDFSNITTGFILYKFYIHDDITTR